MGMSEFWGKVKAEHTALNNDIVFVSKIEEKITVRIQASGVEDDSWFRQFYTEYQGKSVDNYAIRCISIEGAKGEKAKTTPIVLIIRPTIFSQIVGMLVEEMDLLSPKEGFPVTIKKDGTGLNTRYNVMIVPKPFDTSGFEQKDLDEAVKNLTKPKEKKENSFGKQQAEKTTEEPISLEEEGDDDIPF